MHFFTVPAWGAQYVFIVMKKLLLLFVLALGFAAEAQEATPAAIGKCRGLFSVGDSAWVRFSPGNLQYQPSTHLWRFAEAQTEVIGWQPRFALDRYKGWIDLFGWGTALNPTSCSTNAADYDFVDWGRYCALPTEGGKVWRTLSIEEWTYLLAKRRNARRLYAIAYVDGHYGLVLLPDGWQCPKGVYLRPGPKEDAANWCTLEQWARLEAAGAVFLPAEIRRMGTGGQGSSGLCHYWTSTPSARKKSEALYIFLDSYFPQGRSISKAAGLSVRLVQEVGKEEQFSQKDAQLSQ